ncbi:hypothetical protein Bca101_026404 [Brassica carinata]
MNNCSKLPSFPASFVGGRTRPCHPPADPFSSSISAWAEVPEADCELVPMAPLKLHRSYLLDDGPRSEIRSRGDRGMKRRYDLSEGIILRAPSPSDRISDFGVDEVPIYEAYFESGFRGNVPSLVAKLSEFLEISL